MTATEDCSRLIIRLNDDALVILREMVEECGADVPDSVGASLANDNKSIGVEELHWIRSKLKNGNLRIHEILSESEIVLPSPVITPRNPELEARLERLRLEYENREYNAMTKNVDSIRMRHPEDTIGYQVREMNKQLIAVAQFVFSVGAGFVFGFHGLELLIGELEFGFRLLLGVICALIIALAEIYFLAKKLAEEFETTPPILGKSAQTGSLTKSVSQPQTKEHKD